MGPRPAHLSGSPEMPIAFGRVCRGDRARGEQCRFTWLLPCTLVMWLFPQIRGPILVVPIIRTIIYLGSFWGPLFMEGPICCMFVLVETEAAIQHLAELSVSHPHSCLLKPLLLLLMCST